MGKGNVNHEAEKGAKQRIKKWYPIRTFANWDEKMPGFFEVDLVSDEGGP